MAITVSGTTITFNDATTQTTAATSGVTSVATGNGLSGGTITSTGTLTVACPTFNTVGSYAFGATYTFTGTWNLTSGLDIAAGSGSRQMQSSIVSTDSGTRVTNNLSGTWRWLGATFSTLTSPEGTMNSVICRVS